MKKSFLFIMARPPFSTLHAQEMLDMILTAAAFEQTVRLLFIDQGALLLKKHQNPAAIEAKDIAPILDALAIYDVEDLYVESESLSMNGLDPEDLSIATKLLNRINVGELLARHDVVINA